MSSTMPDWPSLWEKEPGLRPDGVDYRPLCTGQFHDDDCWCEDEESHADSIKPSYWLDDLSLEDIPKGRIEALCRDAAVRWLGEVKIVPHNGGHFQVVTYGRTPGAMSPARPTHDGGVFFPASKSLDAALFAACKAVIEARAAGAAT